MGKVEKLILRYIEKRGGEIRLNQDGTEYTIRVLITWMGE